MVPGYLPLPADGKVWVYVHVQDLQTNQNLEDAYVSLSALGQTTRSDYTGASGTVAIQWPNDTATYANVVYPGYTSGTSVFTTSHFGPDFVNVLIHKGTHTATFTMTPGPGGVTTAQTIDPWGTPGPYGTMPEGYTASRGQAAMDLLAFYGYDLVLLAILVTILAMLGVKLGGR